MQHLNGLDSKFAVEFREANQQGATAPGARRVNVARVGRAVSPRKQLPMEGLAQLLLITELSNPGTVPDGWSLGEADARAIGSASSTGS